MAKHSVQINQLLTFFFVGQFRGLLTANNVVVFLATFRFSQEQCQQPQVLFSSQSVEKDLHENAKSVTRHVT